MPIDVSALKALAGAGATVDMLIAAVEAQQAAERQRALEEAEAAREELKAKRDGAKHRKRLERTRRRLGEPSVTDVTRDMCDTPFPLPPPAPPSNPLTPFDDDDDRRARSIKLADQAMAIIGVDRVNTPIRWCGLAEELDRGIQGGWRTDLILAAARKIAAIFAGRAETHPESFGYLTKLIIKAHEHDQARQLPLVGVVSGKEQSHGGQNRRPRAQGGGVAAAGREHLERLAERRRLQADSAEPGEGGEGGDGGGDPGGVLSRHRGRVG